MTAVPRTATRLARYLDGPMKGRELRISQRGTPPPYICSRSGLGAWMHYVRAVETHPLDNPEYRYQGSCESLNCTTPGDM